MNRSLKSQDHSPSSSGNNENPTTEQLPTAPPVPDRTTPARSESSSSTSSYILSLDGERFDLSNLRLPKLSPTGQLYPDVRARARARGKARSRSSNATRTGAALDSYGSILEAMSRSVVHSDEEIHADESRPYIGSKQLNRRHSAPLQMPLYPSLDTEAIGASSHHSIPLDSTFTREEKLSPRNRDNMDTPQKELPMFRGEGLHSSQSSSCSFGDNSANEEDKKPKAKPPATTTTTEGDYLAISLDSDGQPYLKIGPKDRVEWIGTNARTKAAIVAGSGTLKLSCPACQETMTCLSGLEYIVCEACHCISPTAFMEAESQPQLAGMQAGKQIPEQPRGAGIGLVAAQKTPQRTTSM